jgi:molybdopterin/thiamine biosynthesis adenylyltransferase
MLNKINTLVRENQQVAGICYPVVYRAGLAADRQDLENLLDREAGITVHDTLLAQLQELVKLRNPSRRFEADELADAALRHTASVAWAAYGAWVYYPWSKRLVHILDEKEFVEVRTSRNQYKITPEEEELLAGKRVGIIGLSVGQSAAVTMAMERIFGEIRLADFDVLDLSNFNRIRTGVHNLSVPKVIAVAREIAEIDPFLKVTCYSEGITESNIDDFLQKDGKLDLLLDECDGLNIKILSRQRARALAIPVLMETSDRGMLDVERFDLDPRRPILHGLIDHLDLEKVKEAKTNEEKIPFILPMVGYDSISERLRASLPEVGKSISTWPQLASAVTLGGGLATDVSRRILLGTFTASGRYYVDVEELVGDRNK